MADPAPQYTLVTPGGTVVFNDCQVHDGTDCYFTVEITGLDAAPIRNPIDNAPITDGGLIHNFYEGPLHVVFNGYILVQSVTTGNAIQSTRNGMVDDLKTALRSILRANGTLSWTLPGVGAKSLLVRYEQPLAVTGLELLNFTFGLASAASVPS